MLKAKEVKEYAKRCGADLVGIGSMDRWEGAPKQKDPRYIFPEAKVIIGLGFRLPRGYFRGTEEGTYFNNYALMGYAGLNIVYMPIVLRQVCNFLEDNGYEGVPIPNVYEGTPFNIATGEPRKVWTRAVSPEKPVPNVFLDFRIAAFICGMGEIGYSKMFLTPEFGPRQRFVFLLTDAPLEPDPLFEGKICDRCMLCAKDCPGKAISKTETVKVEVAGRTLEWNKLDVKKCSIAYGGGDRGTSPFLNPDVDESEYNNEMYGVKKLRENLSLTSVGMIETRAPIGGGKGCIRACMIHLEQQNKLKNRFKEPFRKRKPWKLY